MHTKKKSHNISNSSWFLILYHVIYVIALIIVSSIKKKKLIPIILILNQACAWVIKYEMLAIMKLKYTLNSSILRGKCNAVKINYKQHTF